MILKPKDAKIVPRVVRLTLNLGDTKLGQNAENLLMPADALTGAALTAVHGALSLDEPCCCSPAACQSAAMQ